MSLGPEQVSAILVTRGNVMLDEIGETLPFRDVVVWDNAVEQNVGVYGRYAAMSRARHQIVYVQDDDAILPADSILALLDAYRPGIVVANMSEHHQEENPDSALLGFGAVFDRHLPAIAFRRWVEALRLDRPLLSTGTLADIAIFLRTCDLIFTALTPCSPISVPYFNRPFASDPDRMYRQPGFVVERELVLAQARELRSSRIAR